MITDLQSVTTRNHPIILVTLNKESDNGPSQLSHPQAYNLRGHLVTVLSDHLATLSFNHSDVKWIN